MKKKTNQKSNNKPIHNHTHITKIARPIRRRIITQLEINLYTNVLHFQYFLGAFFIHGLGFTVGQDA